MKHLGWRYLASLFTLALALAGFTSMGFAATDYINVQFSNGGASQTGAAVIGSAGDYWNKTTGKSGTLSLNKTDNTSSGASLSWSASSIAATNTDCAFISQNTAWKNLFSTYMQVDSGATMTVNFSGLTANIPVRVYFYTQPGSGGNGRKLQASLNGGAYAATTVGSYYLVSTFIKDQNYLVVDGAADGSGQLNINVQGVSGAGGGVGQLMGIQLIASDDIPSLTTPSVEHVGAGMATLLLQANQDATGYFTLLAGSNTACGTAAQVQAGLTSTGAAAPYHGSLPLTANTQGNYTVRNLTQATDYTVCFTADSPTLPSATPVSANLSTTAAHLNGPTWRVVGTAGFSADLADYISLAFAPDGTPYLAYRDNGNNGKTTVMKFTGAAWVTVGSAGFSAGSAPYTSLAFAPDGTPYVAYQDWGNSGKATVMKFNGTAWIAVGAAGFSAGSAPYTSLAVAPNGTPYLAYMDGVNSDKATVMKFNGAAWVTVGAAGFSAGTAQYTSLAFAPDGTPYLAYHDGGNSNKASVKKFNGTAWVTVGTAGFSAGDTYYTSLAFAPDGTPYVAYRDLGNSGKATVMKFNGTAWVTVGSAGFSAGRAVYPTLAVAPDGTPYVAYPDGGNSVKATVMKFNDAAWVTVGAAGFSTEADFPSLALAPDGTPYLAYQDLRNSNKTTVMKFSTAATTTALASSLNPSGFGQAITLTATVSPAAATGTVAFKDGATTLGTGAVSGGSATYTTSDLTVGSHSITAVYGGDSSYAGSTSSPLTQTVKSTLTTTVYSNLNPSTYGQSVMFISSAGSSSATGTITFKDNGVTLGSPQSPLILGYATYSTADLTVGDHLITAVYSGDSNYTGSTSSVLTQTVTKATPTATLNVTNSPVPYDGSPHAAAVGIVTSSVPGVISAILTGGAASQTTAGTYPVTATFTPTDTANYATLTGLSAGNFVITAPSTVALTPPAGIVKSGATNARTWSFKLTNTSATAAANTQVGLTLTPSTGCTPLFSTPVTVGTIAANGGTGPANFLIDFNNCPRSTKFNATFTYTYTGSPTPAPTKTFTTQLQ